MARDKLEPYIDQQLRRNIKGIRTAEQEILLEIFKFFERKYRTERYGFIYDDDFKREFTPYLIREVFVKRYPGAFSGKKEPITYPEVEDMIYNNSILVYLHFPSRKNKKKELLCFESPKLANAYISAHEYTCEFTREYTAEDDMGEKANVQVIQTSTTLQQKYIDLERSRWNTETRGFVKQHRTYMTADVDVVPDLLFEHTTRRMKRLDSYFFSLSCLEYLELIPSGKLERGYDPLALFPYFLFLLTTNLRHNGKFAPALADELVAKNTEEVWNYQKAIKKLYDPTDFDLDDFNFFCYLLIEISDIVKTENWIKNCESSCCAKEEYESCICDFSWNEGPETDLNRHKEIISLLSRIRPYANINALLYETRYNKKMTKLLKQKICTISNVNETTPSSRMLELDYFSEEGL